MRKRTTVLSDGREADPGKINDGSIYKSQSNIDVMRNTISSRVGQSYYDVVVLQVFYGTRT
jgi:hypothetical protein